MSLLEIHNPRLTLRQWRQHDLAPFARLNADPDVMRYFPATLSREESDSMASRCQELIGERGWGFWAAEVRATGEFIGFIGLHIPMAALPFAPCTELGWRLAKSHWGQGLATEGAAASLEHAFQILKIPEVVSFTSIRNVRSEAVMQRLGMQRDKATFAHPSWAAQAGAAVLAEGLCRGGSERSRRRRGFSPVASWYGCGTGRFRP